MTITESPQNQPPVPAREPGLLRRLMSALPRPLRWLVRGVLVAALAVGLFVGAAQVCMRIPVNAGADPDTGDLDVYLVSNGVHVDVWVPAIQPERDWVTWLPPDVPLRSYGFVAFGWGDEGFFLEVPTWDDLTAGVAIKGALWPTRSAMHVKALGGRPRPGDNVHRLRISSEEYAELVAFIDSGFSLDADGRPVMLDHPGYHDYDRFFAGSGLYHIFSTCNSWTNGAVKAMGQKAALWSPFESGVRYHLPPNRGEYPGH